MATIRRAHSSPTLRKYGRPHATLYSPSVYASGDSICPKLQRHGKRSTIQELKNNGDSFTDTPSPKRQPFLVFRPVHPARVTDRVPLKDAKISCDVDQYIPAILLGENGKIEGHFALPRTARSENRLYPCTIHAKTGRRVLRSYPAPIPKACHLPDIPTRSLPAGTDFPPPGDEEQPSLSKTKARSLEEPKLDSCASKSVSNFRLDHGLKRSLRPANSVQNFRMQSMHHSIKAGHSSPLQYKADSTSTGLNLCHSLEMYKYTQEEIRVSQWREAFTVFQRCPTKPRKESDGQDASAEEPPRLSSPFELKESNASMDHNSYQDAFTTSEADDSNSLKQESTDGAHSGHGKWAIKHFKNTLRSWKQFHFAHSQEDLGAHLVPHNDTVTSSPRLPIASKIKTGDTSLGDLPPFLYSPPSISSTPSLSTPWGDVDPTASGIFPQSAKPRVPVIHKISSASLSQAWHDITEASLRYLPKFGRH